MLTHVCGCATTAESALGAEYVQAQQNLQHQYPTQTQGLHQELQTAQRSFNEFLSQEGADRQEQTNILRQKLAEKQQFIRDQANDL